MFVKEGWGRVASRKRREREREGRGRGKGKEGGSEIEGGVPRKIQEGAEGPLTLGDLRMFSAAWAGVGSQLAWRWQRGSSSAGGVRGQGCCGRGRLVEAL